MTPLRQLFIQDLTLRGYAKRTIESYVAVVVRLTRFFQAAPDQLTEDQLRTYLLHLTTTRWSSVARRWRVSFARYAGPRTAPGWVIREGARRGDDEVVRQ